MDSWTADVVKDATNVVLGWVLGLASAELIHWNRSRKKRRQIKVAISRELRESAHRLVALLYRLESRFGGINREFLEWMQPQVQRYEGPNPTDGLLAGVAGLLKQPDAKIQELAAHLQATTPPPFIPADEPSYTIRSVADLHDFEPDYAVRILDVLAHLRMIEQTRQNADHYHRLTFTPGLGDENHRKAIENVNTSHREIAKRARIVIDKIAALEERFR